MIKKEVIFITAPKILFLAMAAVVMLSAGNEEVLGKPRSSYGLGSAEYLKGKNLLFSLYVDTIESSWEEEEKEETLSKLKLAARYIEDAAKEYHNNTELVCDWQKNEDLTGNAEVNFAINDKVDFEDRLDEEIAIWVEEKIDFEQLMEEHHANGIALMVFVNNPGGSYAIVFDGIDNPKESLVLFSEEPASVYAHEILHVFGAHDLYRNAEYTSEVTDYIKKVYPLEIMYTVTDSDGAIYDDRIINMVSPVTAYHLGWIDYTEEIDFFPQLIRKINEKRKGRLNNESYRNSRS